MNLNAVRVLTPIIFAALATPSLAQQSNVSPLNKFCWQENTGWINWRSAGDPAGSQGVFVAHTILSGFAWSENTGYINFGNGSPANGVSYANLDGTDFGVNFDLNTGDLSGLAWGENIGWINFSLPSLPANQQPRLDLDARRFRGYAWSENTGWFNLDLPDSGKFVGFRLCVADFNRDGVLNADDLSDYITGYFNDPSDPATDFNRDGIINADDLSDYITAYFNGCPR